MVESGNSDHEKQFIREEFACHAQESLGALSDIYLGEESDEFNKSLIININTDFEVGNVVPTVPYDTTSGMLALNIEPMSIIEYSEKVLARCEDEDRELCVADLAKFFVGAGVARAIIARKAAALPGADKESRHRYIDKICDKTYLWKAASDFDDERASELTRVDESFFRLRTQVEKMGDDQVPSVNILRFIFGASLNYLSEAHDIQVNIPTFFRQELLEEERSRAIDLNMNLAILDPDSAFDIYNDAVPYLLYGLSFPMTPAEELTSFFAEPIS